MDSRGGRDTILFSPNLSSPTIDYRTRLSYWMSIIVPRSGPLPCLAHSAGELVCSTSETLSLLFMFTAVRVSGAFAGPEPAPCPFPFCGCWRPPSILPFPLRVKTDGSKATFWRASVPDWRCVSRIRWETGRATIPGLHADREGCGGLCVKIIWTPLELDRKPPIDCLSAADSIPSEPFFSSFAHVVANIGYRASKGGVGMGHNCSRPRNAGRRYSRQVSRH